MDKTEAIEKAIELSKETLTYEGLFFDVKVILSLCTTNHD